LFLHGAGGLSWDPFLDALAVNRRVVAPEHPGFGVSQGLEHLEDIWDLVLYYNELLVTLGMVRVDIIGHSFGGMVAAELAANNPERVDRLVMISAIGLWLDDHPIPDFTGVPVDQIRGLILVDPTGPLATHLPAPDSNDPEAMLAAFTRITSITQFIWPLPEKGLRKRLYRLRARTLLVWGAEDKFVDRAYGIAFADAIADARLVVVPHAGPRRPSSPTRATRRGQRCCSQLSELIGVAAAEAFCSRGKDQRRSDENLRSRTGSDPSHP
jgi:pimeloyl-ACP methyl ester carboxylesterase